MPGLAAVPGRCRPLGIVAAAAAAAGLVAAVAPAPVLAHTQILATRLTGAAGEVESLGAGTALIMGGSWLPMPPQGYVDSADALYLQPHGFTGTSHVLYTPELPFTIGTSEIQGAAILVKAINDEIAGGHVDAENPVVVFGYSQSAAMSSLAMAELHDDGVPSDYVHFVFIGNTANPNGGLLERFDIPTGTNYLIPVADLQLGYPTPNLYPTEVYSIEYDGFADFPRYPLNLFASLNAYLGLGLQHMRYMGLTPEQLADAIPLATSDDAITNYYMIPADNLPLVDVLRLLPIIGNPLADLVEPDVRILVNLGYGSIDQGWSEGLANVPVPADLTRVFPADLNWPEVLAALVSGAQDGIRAAAEALADPGNYQPTAVGAIPEFSTLVKSVDAMGLADTPMSSLVLDLVNSALGSSSAENADGSVLLLISQTVDWLSDAYGYLLAITQAMAAQ